jgi:hypothetical protein
MNHPTTIWARWYGLADPGPPADEILGMVPHRLTDRFRAAAEVAYRADHVTDDVASAIEFLRAGWSNSAARQATQNLVTAARDGCTSIRASTAAAERTAAVLAAAMDAVHCAYATADTQIAVRALSDGLQGASEDPAWDLGRHATAIALRASRSAVVTELASRVSVEHAAAIQAMADLLRDLSSDPRARLRSLEPATALLTSGVPADFAARSDTVHRDALAADLNGPDPLRARFAAGVLDALRQAAAMAPAGTVVQLLAYNPDSPSGQGGAAIGLGDVSTADDVAVLVPGVGNSPSAPARTIDAAAKLRAAATAADPGASTAVVAWLGYDVPLSWTHDLPMTPVGVLTDSALALDDEDAVDGGQRLAEFNAALRSEMAPSARLTLIGHSYGSVVVSEAATRSTGVDDIVLLAAPGAGAHVHDARDYRGLGPDHVYALSFEHDPITLPLTDVITSLVVPAVARLPGSTFGPDPVSADFGAQVIDAPSSVPDVTISPSLALPGGLLQAATVNAVSDLDQHPLTNYLAGAAGLAVGAVVVGRYSKVRSRRGR